jgi:hypothetical protein
MRCLISLMVAVSVFAVAHTGATDESTQAPQPPFVLSERPNPEVRISMTNPPAEMLKFGGYPADPFPTLAYSRTKAAPTSVLFGVSFTYQDAGGEQRPVFLTLTEPHILSNATGTVTFSPLESFQLNATLGMQVQGKGTLLIALFEALDAKHRDSKVNARAGATTGGNTPMTFYSGKARTTASYGRQISNLLKINASVGGQ